MTLSRILPFLDFESPTTGYSEPFNMARTNIKLFCGNSNPALALDVAKMLDVELSDVTVRLQRKCRPFMLLTLNEVCERR